MGRLIPTLIIIHCLSYEWINQTVEAQELPLRRAYGSDADWIWVTEKSYWTFWDKWERAASEE